MSRQVEFTPGEERQCKRCTKLIVWLTSKKGKPYPVNFRGGFPIVFANDFHNCKEDKNKAYFEKCQTGVDDKSLFVK